MGRYRKIDPRIWNDLKFRTLSDNGKLTFLFALTHPHMTSLGAMRATPSGLGEELGWTSKAFREAFEEVLSKGLLKYDPEASCLVVPNFLKYNPPENPNVIKSWEKILDLIPECGLQVTLFQYVKDFVEGLGESFVKALPKEVERVCQYPNPNPIPIPSPEPERSKDLSPEATPAPSSNSKMTPDKLATLWNEKAPVELSKVNLPFRRSPKAMEKIRDALKRNPEAVWWLSVIERVHQSPFLRGEKGWKANIDFVVGKAEEILDGKYDGGGRICSQPGIAEWLRESEPQGVEIGK